MEGKNNGIYCKNGDIVRIKGLSNTVKVMILDSSEKTVQVMQND